MTQAKLTGSCLCGSVQYEITGEPKRFYHCHCSRCKVPEAERFSTRFCTRCGSPLPRVNKEAGVAIIPAGSLDGEPPLAPQARIFWDSRVSWSCGGDDLPVFAEYPPAQ
ncbi:MAG: GFA family protein [Gammaproteobacteria bacterium]